MEIIERELEKVNGRDIDRTSGLTDVDMALKFYDDFNEPEVEFFGRIIPTEIFNEWIDSLNFSHINHGWETPEGNTAWSGYRSTVRGYLMNGVMDPEYGMKVNRGDCEPYIVRVHQHGVNLKIVKYSDYIITTAMGLASKRQNTIKGQTRALKRGFNAMKEVYQVKDLSLDLQEKLIETQNEMRLHIENAFDEIYKKTVRETTDLIEASRKAVRQIAMFSPGSADNSE